MINKPVFALSLVGGSVTYCVAKEVGDETHFIKLKKIEGRFGIWKKEAKKLLDEAKTKGWHILIDDATSPSQFSGYGLTIDLGDVDEDSGQTYQNIALNQYMARAALGLEETKAIKDNGSVMLLGSLAFIGDVKQKAIRPNEQKINIDFDSKGRPVYDIEGGLDSGERALMLALLGVTGTTVQDEEYANSLFAAIESEFEAENGSANTMPNSSIGKMLMNASRSDFVGKFE